MISRRRGTKSACHFVVDQIAFTTICLLIVVVAGIIVDERCNGEETMSLSTSSNSTSSSSNDKGGGGKQPMSVLFIGLNSGPSHLALGISLANIMADRGHHVHFLVLLEATLEQKPVHIKPRSDGTLNVWFYEIFKAKAEKEKAKKAKGVSNIKREASSVSWVQRFLEQPERERKGNWPAALEGMIGESVELFLSNSSAVEELRRWPLGVGRKHFDMGVAEAWYIAMFALFDVLAIRNTVTYSAQPLYPTLSHTFGIPHPVNVPDMYSVNMTLDWRRHKADGGAIMDCTQRHKNIIEYRESVRQFKLGYERINEKLRPLVLSYKKQRETKGRQNDFTGVERLLARSSFLFVNTLEQLDFPRPFPSKLKYIGGINVPNGLKLLKNGQRSATNLHLDQSVRNFIEPSGQPPTAVVVISFGGLLDPQEGPEWALRNFLDAFNTLDMEAEERKQQRYRFIMKYRHGVSSSHDSLIGSHLVTKKGIVKTMDWIPQMELLQHPNTRLFISHCGQNGLLEAVYTGVPLLCIPFFGDQDYNAAAVEYRGIGRAVKLSDIRLSGNVSETIREAIQDVVENQTYKKRLDVMRRKLSLRPLTPLDVFVQNVEFAGALEVANNGETEVDDSKDSKERHFIVYSDNKNAANDDVCQI